jgi:hypothetical protein
VALLRRSRASDAPEAASDPTPGTGDQPEVEPVGAEAA